MSAASIPEVIDDLRRGCVVCVVDDTEDAVDARLVLLAERVTPAAMEFMDAAGGGPTGLALAAEDYDRLGLDPYSSAPMLGLAMSVDAALGARDGASAAARAHTIRRASAPGANPGDLIHPGHVYPLRAHPQGVLVRTGHAEAAVDLARLAETRAAAVLCPIAGDYTTLPAIEAHARRHALRVCLLKDLLAWRQRHESLLELIETDVPLPTEFGEFRAHLFRSRIDAKEHLALSVGLARADADGRRPALEANCYVRVHSECLTGDVFHSLRCDCGPQLARALGILGGKPHGVLAYMRQEGRGIGLANKLRAYRLQDAGFDTVEANQALGFAADLRDYASSARILSQLGARRVTLLTNNPGKPRGLGRYGIDVIGQEPLETLPNARNLKYLRAKRDKLGHSLTGIDAIEP